MIITTKKKENLRKSMLKNEEFIVTIGFTDIATDVHNKHNSQKTLKKKSREDIPTLKNNKAVEHQGIKRRINEKNKNPRRTPKHFT